MTEQFFSLLCNLEKFDLGGNPSINKKTLAGHLACTFTNLKDQASIDASSMGLTGAMRGGLFKRAGAEAN